MSSVAATANANEEQYKQLEAAAMEMGKTTTKTATESAQALEYMSLAGWSVEQSIKGLPSVLRLSEATGLELATTSDLVTDSMSALGVTVDGLSEYLDIAAKANNKSNQSAQQLMEAYLGVGGTMKNLNVPLAESATALGVLANRGIKGSEGGTALNAIMVNLTTGAGKAGTAMKKLGVSAFDSDGKFIGLEATLQQLNTALAGCTEEQRNAYLSAIGGKTHVDALNDLLSGLNTTLDDGSTEWEALQRNLENSKGALEEMASVKMDNLNGDFASFQSRLQDFGIKIYKNIQEPLRNAVQFATQQITALSDAFETGGFTGLAEKIGDVLANVATEAVKVAPKFVEAAGTAVHGFFQGIQENAPILGEGAAVLASTLISSFTQFFGDFWETGVTLVAQFLNGMVSKAPNLIDGMFSMLESLGETIVENLPMIIESGVQLILQLADGIMEHLPQFVSIGIQIVIQLGIGIIKALPQILMSADNILNNLFDALWSGIVDGVEKGLGPLASVAKEKLTAAFQKAVDGAKKQFSKFTSNVKKMADDAKKNLDKLKKAFSEKFEDIKDTVGKCMKAAQEVASEKLKNMRDAYESHGGGMKGAVAAAMEGIKGYYTAGYNFIDKLTNGKLSDVVSYFKSKLGDAASIVQQKLESIKGWFSSKLDSVKTTVKNALNSVKNFFSSGMQSAHDTVSSILNNIKNKFSSIMDSAKNIVSNAVTAIKNFFNFKWSLPALGTSILETAKTTVSKAVSYIKGLFNFSWSLPKIKTPHFYISGYTKVLGVSIPSIGVSWYKNGGILDGAQIFGAAGGNLLGGGEAGKEAVLPLSQLWKQMRSIMGEYLAPNNSDAIGGVLRDLTDKMRLAGSSGDSTLAKALNALLGEPGPAPKPALAGGPNPAHQIVYSPTYQFYGEAPSEDDLVEASRMSQEEFNAMMDEYFKDHNRKDF